jgi:hypothetical protein
MLRCQRHAIGRQLCLAALAALRTLRSEWALDHFNISISAWPNYATDVRREHEDLVICIGQEIVP